MLGTKEREERSRMSEEEGFKWKMESTREGVEGKVLRISGGLKVSS